MRYAAIADLRPNMVLVLQICGDMDVHSQLRIKDIASASEQARGLLERSGVDYCCEGDASLLEGCAHAGADLAAIEQGLHDVPEEAGQWHDVAELVDHVVHHVRPRTERAIERARTVSQGHAGLAGAVDDLAWFATREMKVDDGIFAYVRALAEARQGRASFPPPSGTTLREHAARMRKRHARLHDRLRNVGALARGIGPEQRRSTSSRARSCCTSTS